AKETRKIKRAALILHDIGSKQERKEWVEQFKAGKIDLLFVYNMLLTGFDAKRLKKLYLGRVIRKHNLLQA
ncbi:type I restriction enzyme subunit R domain-containing protein, partial [Shigella sonnei]